MAGTLPDFQIPALEEALEGSVDFVESLVCYPLDDLPECPDVGVYLIYLENAEATPYGHIDIEWQRAPVYIGKAVLPGSRQGKSLGTFPGLTKRLGEHARSIGVTDLSVADFCARFVPCRGAVAGVIPGIESFLIRHYQPMWNTCIDGFGNHDPGRGRYEQAWSDWDSLHQGRSWTKRLKTQPKGPALVIEKVERKYGTI